ncbi:protein atonal homolog 8 isoform X2 [Rhinatrema bivittatum]|uniref:protein atonal homolog 8 isoform X2 n=1 Tax=Rhinatrema bivittatum TaxID=194408 RepID=UPI001129896D|nr:protein atonal homolog 8 isoform X2 [Rhinatrema bivittatum]
MKNLQMIDERHWKPLCVKEINGIKKVKRKSKEALKQVNGFRSFRAAGLGNGTAAAAAAEGGSCESPPAAGRGGQGAAGEAMDLRTGAFPSRGRDALAPFQGFEPPTLTEPSRIVLCPRGPEGGGGAASHPPREAYGRGSPDPAGSPRRRQGDGAAGLPSEIKAIQQSRRLLANARERTRVHTISAAFEALRKQVPCYSYGQKLSKLAILRIACNYILSLATLADLDYSADHNKMSFSECVEQCTRTLQAEGRSKKRKE